MPMHRPLLPDVIAAMYDIVLGGGLEVALGCDYRVALDSATPGLPGSPSRAVPGRRWCPAPVASDWRRSGVGDYRVRQAGETHRMGLVDATGTDDLKTGALAYTR